MFSYNQILFQWLFAFSAILPPDGAFAQELMIRTHLSESSTSASNSSSTALLTFSPKNFFEALNRKCKPFAKNLEACPQNREKSSKSRFNSAQLYAECLSRVYGESFACSAPFTSLKILPVEAFPAMYNTANSSSWPVLAPLDFDTDKSFKLPEIVPIIEKACIFDYGVIQNSTCCKDGPNTDSKKTCGRESFNLLACSIQSLHTYVSCTSNIEETEVAECVTRTAPRINFVPIGFQINGAGNKCDSPEATIRHLVFQNIGAFLIFLLFTNTGVFRRLLKSCTTDPGCLVRNTSFKVSVLGFWASVAGKIGENVVIVGVILAKQGYQVDMMKNFVIFAIRPNPAVFKALLGVVDGGWSHDGLVEMLMQILLSIFGGYLALFGAISANHTEDPSRPDWWKSYLAGGIIASLTTDFIWIYFSIVCNCLWCICCGKAGPKMVGKLLKGPAVIIWFTIYSVLKQLKVMCQNAVRKIQKQPTRDWHPPLDMDENPLRILYILAMILCFVLYVGSWMFWVGFLRLSGELYCPQEFSKIDYTVIGFTLLIVLVRKAIAFLSNGSDDSSFQDALEMRPDGAFKII